MTSVVEGAKMPATRGTDIGARVKALDVAVGAARGRLDDTLLDGAAEVVVRAADRLRLSADHTVVALGGATGSGKSSTFNALVGLELASTGVRRPTTSWATACTWGRNGAAELLEWLGIPPRHQTVRDSMLDTGREAKDLDGLVLLDLPDHDSTEVSHHLEVDRLVRLADLLVWVLDPQKYADAAIHDRFLKPLAAHKGVMMIVLNHIDEVAEERRDGMVADLRRLLDADGLDGITVVAVSAREGIGIDELRRAIIARVADKAATRARISTNLADITAQLAVANGDAAPPHLGEVDRSALRDAVAEAAGVPVVVRTVEQASLIRNRRATSWPVTFWISRLRSDPLKKLGLDLSASDRQLVSAARSSLPDANQVQNARVDAVVRRIGDRLSADLTRPWATAVGRAASAGLVDLETRLDQAVGSTDLGIGRIPVWTRMVRGIQWLLLLATIAGGAWTIAHAVSTSTKLSWPQEGGVPLAVLLLAGGAALGLLLSLSCRLLVAKSAKRRASAADASLRRAVTAVTDELVVDPVNAELEAYRRTTEALGTARG
ncbi:MAG: transporter [Marmoricola sp.]|nr:transporter [Marmoricola sp.]